MKHNPNTRNIFTKEGRLNRLIDKRNRTISLINKMNESIKAIESSPDSEISIDDINKNVYPDYESDNEECIIRCDECSHEFDIINKKIKKIPVPNTDDEDEIKILYVCPNCGHQNEVELDDEEDEECNEKGHASISSETEYVEESQDNEDEPETVDESLDKEQDKDLKNIVRDINIKNRKSQKVILNRYISYKFISDEKINNIIKEAINHKSTSEIINSLTSKGINIEKQSTGIPTSYKSNNFSIIVNKNDADMVEIFKIVLKPTIIPHGDPIKFYNGILNKLNIEKYHDEYKYIGIEGKACIIKLPDNSLAACNFNIDGKFIIMTFIYNIDKEPFINE